MAQEYGRKPRPRLLNPDDVGAPQSSSGAGGGGAPSAERPAAPERGRVAGKGGTPGYSYYENGRRVDVAARKEGERLPSDSSPPYVQAARQQMAASRANLASGGGRRAPAVAPATPVPQGQVITSPVTGPSPAAMNRPKEDWGTPAPIPGGRTAGVGEGQRLVNNIESNRIAFDAAHGAGAATGGGVQAAMQPVAGGTGYKAIEAGTIGDPNKPGAHRVIITGPNKYETHMNVPWRDEEGIYGKKGAVYNVDSVIGHSGSPHSRENFFPNPDYAAQVAGPPAKPGVGGFSMVGDVAGAPSVPERLAPVTQPEKTGGVQLAMDGKPIVNFGGTPVAQPSGVDLSFQNLTGMKGPATGPETAQSPVDRLAAVMPAGGLPVQGGNGIPVAPAAPTWGVGFGGGRSNQAQDNTTGVPPAAAGPYPMGTPNNAQGGSVPAGVSNKQAANIQTPTNANAIAKTETAPEMDINKTDQTTAAFLGGGAPRRTAYVPPPPPPPEEQPVQRPSEYQNA